MSINEIEAKCREIRQLQNLIQEAEDEMEALKDAIKAHMGDSEELRARGVQDHLESGHGFQAEQQGPKSGPPRGG